MAERPDYIKHVSHTRIDMLKTSWCGVDVSMQFHFLGADHAAENGQQEGFLVACPECVEAIIKALKNGH